MNEGWRFGRRTNRNEEGPTAAAVPNAQRAGGALVVAALAAALF